MNQPKAKVLETQYTDFKKNVVIDKSAELQNLILRLI